MVKKYSVPIDPGAFESGEIAGMTGSNDGYFTNDVEPTVRMVLDVFLSLLPDNHRNAVEMCIMANLTYEEAAERISIQRGIKTDKKTVWRWARAGMSQLQKWLSDSPWVEPLTNGKIPVDRLKTTLTADLPWEDNDG